MIKKLIKIQKELKVPKNQVNKFGGYKYRNAEDILEAVKPLLAQEGLLLTLSDDIGIFGQVGDEKLTTDNTERFYVKATAKITDGEKSVEATGYAREAISKKGMDEAQITGACSSYARKYALNGLFLIDDTKDADFYENKEQPKFTIADLVERVNKAKMEELDDIKIKVADMDLTYPQRTVLNNAIKSRQDEAK